MSLSRGDMVDISISISISKRLSANQLVLYTYADLVLTAGHNNDISIGRRLMLMSQLFPLAYVLFTFMPVLMLVLQVRTWLN